MSIQTASPPLSKAQGLTRVMMDFYALTTTMPVIQAMIFLHVATSTLQPNAKGLTVTDVASAHNMELSRASRNLRDLIGAGLIEAARDPFDPRYKLNRVSKAGREFLGQLVSHVG